MTTVNLDLTAFRLMTADQQNAFTLTFHRELGRLLNDPQVGSALSAIFAAVNAASSDSNAIDLTSLATTPDLLTRMLIILKNVEGPAGPAGQPPSFLQKFVGSVRTTYPAVDTYLLAAGKRDFH